MSTSTTHTARTESIARIWEQNPLRAVTVSTGVVHVAREDGSTVCATRSATRTAAQGLTPTCRNCGAEPVAERTTEPVAEPVPPFTPGQRVKRVTDGAVGTVEGVERYETPAMYRIPASDWNVRVTLDDGDIDVIGTEHAWTSDLKCRTIHTAGHTFEDDTTRPPYTSLGGDVRQWQTCTGCGNVTNRLVAATTDSDPYFIARDLIRRAVSDGGASVWVGETAESGYLVGMLGRGVQITGDPTSERVLTIATTWVRSTLGAWGKHAGSTLGSWIDGDTLYLDVSQHYASEVDASTACQNRAELAYWDIANGREVRADGAVSAADLVVGDWLESGFSVASVERFDGHDETDHTVRVWTDATLHGAGPLTLRPSEPVARIIY